MPKAKTSKKTKKIKSAGLSKKPLLVLVAALFIAIGVAAMLQTYAWDGKTKICNSDYSDAPIKVWDTDSSSHQTLGWGACTTGGWWNLHDNLRVDVDPDISGYKDINSYKLGEIGVGWYACHKGTENSGSNPPPVGGVRYRNYAGSSC